MGADATHLDIKGIGDRAFSRCGLATVVMQILLMVGRFDVDGGAKLTLVDVNIDIEEGDMGLGGVPGEVDRIATVGPFEEGDEGVWTMWLEYEYVIDKPQLEAGFIGLGVKEILLKVAHEQISIGGGHPGSNDGS